MNARRQTTSTPTGCSPTSAPVYAPFIPTSHLEHHTTRKYFSNVVFTFSMPPLFLYNMKLSPRWTTAIYTLVRGRGWIMRITLAVAVACFSLVAVTIGKDAEAAVRRQTNIAAQGLAPALKILAKERDVQLVYRAELVGDHQTSGAAGDLTFEEALTQLLSGTGLTYRYLENNAITIVPVTSGSSSTLSTSEQTVGIVGSGVSESTNGSQSQQGADQKKGVGERFQLAQVDQGKASGSSNDGVKSAKRTASENGIAQEAPARKDVVADGLQEITVTATRREETLSRVPVSAIAFSQDTLDKQDAHSVQDLVAFVPGLLNNPVSNTISIRGISTGAGPATTGLYINDTPVQFTSLGTESVGAAPYIFDVQRVEVLRGPQGTLFGAGAEGGVVRFILNGPSLTDFSTYSKGDVFSVQNGGMGWELGSAVGGPIIKDVVGLRVSADYRSNAGWIDQVDYNSGNLTARNDNYGGQTSLRAALTIAPVENLTIMPSVLYQRIYSHNESPGQNAYSPYWSDPSSGHFADNLPIGQPETNSFLLYTTDIKWELPNVTLFSNTSYFDRREAYDKDYTLYVAGVFGVATPRGLNDPGLPNYTAQGYEPNTQDDLTQEFRVQSSDANAKLKWLAGTFLSTTRQSYGDTLYDPMGNQFIESVFGQTIEQLTGLPQYPPDISFATSRRLDRKQVSGFADATWNMIDRLALDVGARVAHESLSFSSVQYGPYGGPFTSASASESDNPVTPKVTLSYQMDHDLFYATVAKGYRPGGGNRPVPTTFCASDLKKLGLSAAPTVYDSDSTWNYEVGAKDTLFNGNVQLASSVYWINWKSIQTDIILPTCGSDYTTNAGEARSTGFDLQADFRLGPALTLGVAGGYNDAIYTKTVVSGPGSILVNSGNTLSTPPWTAAVTGTYRADVFGARGYARADYLYSAAYKGQSPSTDPLTTSYIAGTFLPPTTHWLNLRLGVIYNSWDFSLYSTNLTNSHPILSFLPPSISNYPYSETTIQPRTVGITAIAKY
jgi:iron complex outermembrane receptor protein